MIEHLPPHASDQSLDVSVGLRGPVGAEHDLHAFGGEDRIEPAAVLGVAVADEEPHGEIGVVVQIHHHVPRLLGHPGPLRVGACPDPEDPARLDVHEYHHVQSLEEHGLDGEEDGM